MPSKCEGSNYAAKAINTRNQSTFRPMLKLKAENQFQVSRSTIAVPEGRHFKSVWMRKVAYTTRVLNKD
ncbi:hypothetical protein OUZ56_015738 [Daphnia magna]|uniref:Uncharacterized protein n=1 Tax=Daphnia magna TaxID=35525 RepID=A0ABR0ANP6_9CRUS|nr:hypothetical protein OUZ56_015738 [Daphnia magna]